MLGSEKLTIVLSIYELLAAILRNHVNHFGKEFAVKFKENSEIDNEQTFKGSKYDYLNFRGGGIIKDQSEINRSDHSS